MAYNKHKWIAPEGGNLNRFIKENETADSVNLIQDPQLTNVPTPFSAEWMNEMEEGIEAVNSKVSKSGDKMAGPLNFANSTLNMVGDDASIGDQDVGGALIVRGENAPGEIIIRDPGQTGGGFYVKSQINAKQEKIPAGANGYLATHSGEAGKFGNPVPQSGFLTPAQAASGYLAKSKISLNGNTLTIDLT